ncbi:MAG: hypothetical protein IT486_11605 [Gammaproteobacteria bacterium]|nr:hypothetical protein [Gammaproteobacteria bacterium]
MLLAVLAGVAPTAGAVSVRLEAAGGAGGGYGNRLVFSGADIAVTASAWAETAAKAPDGAGYFPFETAEVWSWEHGLGICNRTEGLAPVTCDANEREIDTIGRDDLLMLVFDRRVTFESIEVMPHDGPGQDANDRDILYWVGNVVVAPDLTGQRFSTLATMPGFGSGVPGVAGSAFAPFTHALTGSGNLLLVSGNSALRRCKVDDVIRDRGCESYAISAVTIAAVPVPAGAVLFAPTLVALALVRRLARR